MFSEGEHPPVDRVAVPAPDEEQNEPDGGSSSAPPLPLSQTQAQVDWCLYITGSVRKPGIYNLPPGSRVFQLIEAAGGFDGFADPAALNLAERLEDGQHVHVPKKTENAPPVSLRGRRETQGKGMMIVIEGPSRPRLNLQAPGGSSTSLRSGGEPVDINRASEEELTRLRGIGPALARRIVEYRQQHGPFRSVEELAQVRGIGAVKVNGLRGQATVSP